MTPSEFEQRSYFRRLVVETRKRANLKRMACTITFEWVWERYQEQNGRCALTGIQFTATREPGFTRNPYAPSIDRIKSSRGYTRGNCRLVCCAANLAMGEWGESILAELALGYAQMQARNGAAE